MQQPRVTRIAEEIHASAEQGRGRRGIHDQATQRLVVPARRFLGACNRILERGVIKLARDSQADTEVEVPDPEQVDFRQRRDGVDIFRRPLGLHQHRQDRPGIRRRELVGHRPFGEAVVLNAESHSPLSLRRVLGHLDERLHIGQRFRFRDHDAFGASIERPVDVVTLSRRDPHHRGQPGRLHVTQRSFQRVHAEAAVLGIEERKVATGCLQHMADSGGVELDNERPGLQRPGPSHLFEGHGDSLPRARCIWSKAKHSRIRCLLACMEPISNACGRDQRRNLTGWTCSRDRRGQKGKDSTLPEARDRATVSAARSWFGQATRGAVLRVVCGPDRKRLIPADPGRPRNGEAGKLQRCLLRRWRPAG